MEDVVVVGDVIALGLCGRGCLGGARGDGGWWQISRICDFGKSVRELMTSTS